MKARSSSSDSTTSDADRNKKFAAWKLKQPVTPVAIKAMLGKAHPRAASHSTTAKDVVVSLSRAMDFFFSQTRNCENRGQRQNSDGARRW